MRLKFYINLPLHLIIEHPFDFFRKVAFQLNLGEVAFSRSKERKRSNPKVENLVLVGEYSKALSEMRANRKDSLKYPFLSIYLQNKLEELSEFPPSRQFGSQADGNRDLRVMYLLTNSVPYTNSGYSIRSHELLKALKRAGIPVFGVTRLGYPLTIGKPIYDVHQEIDGISYHRIIPDRMPFLFSGRKSKSIELIGELAKRKKVSILHTTTNYSNAIVASRVARELNIPWIYEVRGELENTWLSRLPKGLQEIAQHSEFYRKSRDLETRYAQDADAVIALSITSKRQLVARGVEEKKIFLAPNAVDDAISTKRFNRLALREKFGLPTNKKLVGTVSSLVEYEGIEYLIQSLLYLPDDYEALIIGDGLAGQSLEDLVEHLGLEDRVTFVGSKPQDEIEEWYAVLDVFVMPRLDTPVCRTVTPLKALMAQALGVPVVASDLPAIREVTGNVENYVSPESAESLAEKISSAKPHDRGKKWASQRTWKNSVKELEAIYKMVLDSKV